MFNIVIPCGGNGKRFKDSGYDLPKPLIDVDGKPMLRRVLENVDLDGLYIFVANDSQMKDYGLTFLEECIKPVMAVHNNYRILLEHEKQGAAKGVLLSKPLIDNNDELLILNSDQLVGERDIQEAVRYFRKNDADAGILTFFNRQMKWSYAALNESGDVTRVAEKQVISDFATCGIYYFRYGRYFVEAAEEMIAKDDKVNGEFYVCPAINYAILKGLKVLPYMVNEMYGLGTPEDLKNYVSHISQR